MTVLFMPKLATRRPITIIGVGRKNSRKIYRVPITKLLLRNQVNYSWFFSWESLKLGSKCTSVNHAIMCFIIYRRNGFGGQLCGSVSHCVHLVSRF